MGETGTVFGYYGAVYEPEELQGRYAALVSDYEHALKKTLEEDRHYAHEASPEIEIGEVFKNCIRKKESWQIRSLPYIPDSFPGTVYRLCPFVSGDKADACQPEENRKKVYLLSNAQRIFTAYEMNVLGITPFLMIF